MSVLIQDVGAETQLLGIRSPRKQLLHLPRLITVKPRREDAVDICACANEEEHDQEESLELENAEHRVSSFRGSRRGFESACRWCSWW